MNEAVGNHPRRRAHAVTPSANRPTSRSNQLRFDGLLCALRWKLNRPSTSSGPFGNVGWFAMGIRSLLLFVCSCVLRDKKNEGPLDSGSWRLLVRFREGRGAEARFDHNSTRLIAFCSDSRSATAATITRTFQLGCTLAQVLVQKQQKMFVKGS